MEFSKDNGRILSINVSETRGVQKKPTDEVELRKAYGIIGDAHAGPKDETRQISFLAQESVDFQQGKIIKNGSEVKLLPGAFGENFTTEGVDITGLKLDDRLLIGNDVILEVSRLGKVCPKPCAIYFLTGDCIMPKEGIFTRVITSGKIRTGDKVVVMLAKKNDRKYDE